MKSSFDPTLYEAPCLRCQTEGEVANDICTECSGEGWIRCHQHQDRRDPCRRPNGTRICYCEAAWERQQEDLVESGASCSFAAPQTIHDYLKQKGRL